MEFITNHAEYPATYLRNEITKQTFPYHAWRPGECERVRLAVQELLNALIDALVMGGLLSANDRHSVKAVKSAYKRFMAL